MQRLFTKISLSIFTLLLAVFALTGTASAHARLKSSTPSDGEVLTSQPTVVNTVYGEETSLTQSTLEVWYAASAGATQVRADNGDAKVDVNDRTKMSVTLKPGMGNGVYTVKWHTLTEDDNGSADGTFTFTVNNGGTATGPTGGTGTVEEHEHEDTASNLPKTGSGDNFTSILALVALLTLGIGLVLRRQIAR